MPNQSASSVSTTEEIKMKIIKNEILSSDELERLKIYARNPKSCEELSQTPGLINKLTKMIFEDALKSEGLKVLINIATNEGTSRKSIALAAEYGIKNCFQTKLSSEDQFILCRLLFLLSIDFEGAKLLAQTVEIENFITEKFEESGTTDNSELGKIIIDILRFRYNLIRNDLIDHVKAVEEATINVMDKCDVSGETVNILGSCLNLSLGKGPENVIYRGKIEKFTEILELMMKMYLNNENKDYLGTVLMIAVNLAEKEEYRKTLRHRFLSTQNKKFINDWKRLLIVSDTSITFLSGELLFKLCKGNTARLLRHVSFESAAGFLYSKGIFKNGIYKTDTPVDPNGESSDEEYFNSHPVEAVNHTPLVPETEEEEKELEYLMQKISDYNSKLQK